MPMLSWPPVTMSLTLSALGRISGQGTRPEFGGQLFGNRRHIRDPAVQIARIVQVHDHRMIGRTPLHLEYLAHGSRVAGIRAQSVDGLGREYHQFAGAQFFDGFFDFCLCRSYHGRMISRLRYQQSSHRFGKADLCRNANFWCGFAPTRSQLSAEGYIA
jgi:hypothetical protein